MKPASRRGISPVIATVILVAVTIAVAIAVAFWMTGIVGLFAGAVEKLEIISLYARPNATAWNVTLMVRNTGTTSTSIDTIFVSGIPIDQCRGNITNPRPGLPVVMNPGDNRTIAFIIRRDTQCGPTTFKPGVTIEVKLHTTGGREYPKLITLP